MNDVIEAATTNSLVAVPLILALVQVVKMVGLASKWAPICSIGFGIIISFFVGDFGSTDFHIGHTLLSGVIYGLTASGLFSATKTMAHAPQGANNNEQGPPKQ